MGDTGRHLADRGEAVDTFHLLIVILLDFIVGFAQSVNHRVEADHQAADLVFALWLQTDSEIAFFDLRHSCRHGL